VAEVCGWSSVSKQYVSLEKPFGLASVI